MALVVSQLAFTPARFLWPDFSCSIPSHLRLLSTLAYILRSGLISKLATSTLSYALWVVSNPERVLGGKSVSNSLSPSHTLSLTRITQTHLRVFWISNHWSWWFFFSRVSDLHLGSLVQTSGECLLLFSLPVFNPPTTFFFPQIRFWMDVCFIFHFLFFFPPSTYLSILFHFLDVLWWLNCMSLEVMWVRVRNVNIYSYLARPHHTAA